MTPPSQSLRGHGGHAAQGKDHAGVTLRTHAGSSSSRFQCALGSPPVGGSPDALSDSLSNVSGARLDDRCSSQGLPSGVVGYRDVAGSLACTARGDDRL